jgi:lipopolysaccharide/colanic/teichoic acid biosynthesis glycosyltransferase
MNTSQEPKPDTKLSQRESHSKRGVILWVLGSLAVVVLVIAVVVAIRIAHKNSTPATPDFATTRTSDRRLYKVSFKSALEPIPINEIHTWTIHLETSVGKPVENAKISVDGLMPEHGHGLPTEPQITNYLGNGDYTVEGMKFQMTGWWQVNFHIATNGQSDKVTFNLMLK